MTVRTVTRTAIAGLALAALPMGAIAAPAAPTIELVSAARGGGGGTGDSSAGTEKGLDVSADGRYVVFSSYATDLVAHDTNNQRDVFVRDTRTGRTRLVSVGVGGAQGNGESREGSISADGRYVAFNSFATNLVPGDTNNSPDVFVRDLRTGRTTLASAGPNGLADNGAHQPEISADGKHVVFTSGSTNLVADDTNGTEDVFVRDLVTRRTDRISVGASGEQLDLYSREPTISGNGRYAVFVTAASTVSVRDRLKNTTRVISDGVVLDPRTVVTEFGYTAFSADGRSVIFTVTEYQAVGFDPVPNIWLRDLRTNRLELITGAGSPSTTISPVRRSDVSGDGRYVTFSTTARLTPADTDELSDVFRLDRKTGKRVWITRGQQPTTGGGTGSFGPAISDDGRHVAFDSENGLVPGVSGSQTYLWSK